MGKKEEIDLTSGLGDLTKEISRFGDNVISALTKMSGEEMKRKVSKSTKKAAQEGLKEGLENVDNVDFDLSQKVTPDEKNLKKKTKQATTDAITEGAKEGVQDGKKAKVDIGESTDVDGASFEEKVKDVVADSGQQGVKKGTEKLKKKKTTVKTSEVIEVDNAGLNKRFDEIGVILGNAYRKLLKDGKVAYNVDVFNKDELKEILGLFKELGQIAEKTGRKLTPAEQVMLRVMQGDFKIESSKSYSKGYIDDFNAYAKDIDVLTDAAARYYSSMEAAGEAAEKNKNRIKGAEKELLNLTNQVDKIKSGKDSETISNTLGNLNEFIEKYQSNPIFNTQVNSARDLVDRLVAIRTEYQKDAAEADKLTFSIDELNAELEESGQYIRNQTGDSTNSRIGWTVATDRMIDTKNVYNVDTGERTETIVAHFDKIGKAYVQTEKEIFEWQQKINQASADGRTATGMNKKLAELETYRNELRKYLEDAVANPELVTTQAQLDIIDDELAKRRRLWQIEQQIKDEKKADIELEKEKKQLISEINHMQNMELKVQGQSTKLNEIEALADKNGILSQFSGNIQTARKLLDEVTKDTEIITDSTKYNHVREIISYINSEIKKTIDYNKEIENAYAENEKWNERATEEYNKQVELVSKIRSILQLNPDLQYKYGSQVDDYAYNLSLMTKTDVTSAQGAQWVKDLSGDLIELGNIIESDANKLAYFSQNEAKIQKVAFSLDEIEKKIAERSLGSTILDSNAIDGLQTFSDKILQIREELSRVSSNDALDYIRNKMIPDLNKAVEESVGNEKLATRIEKQRIVVAKLKNTIESNDKLSKQFKGTLDSIINDLGKVGTSGAAFDRIKDRIEILNGQVTNAKNNIEDLNKQTNVSGIEGTIQSITSKGLDRFIQPEFKAFMDEFNSFKATLATGVIPPNAESEIKRFATEIGDLKTQAASAAQEVKQFASQFDIDSVAAKINSFIRENKKLSTSTKDDLNSLLSQLRLGSTTKQDLKEINLELKNIKSSAKAAGETGRTFAQIWKSGAQNLLRYLSTFSSFYRVVGYIKTAISTVTELDEALIDLRKTTTMTNEELSSFYTNSSNTARQLGVTTKEIISQAAAWSRLGYSSKSAATEMAALSSQFAQISPGMNVDKATDGLVSSMKAFHVEVNDVERQIMDNVNRIGRLLPKHTVMYGIA